MPRDNINKPAPSDEDWIDMLTADGSPWNQELTLEAAPKQDEPT